MAEPVALNRPGRALRTVPDSSPPEAQLNPELVARLAAALVDLRGYVPAHVWWDSGAAGVLMEYQATKPD